MNQKTKTKKDDLGRDCPYAPVDRATETSIDFPGGAFVCPAHPAECEYIRVVDHEGYEMGYWDEAEFEDDSADTMGALMGCAADLELTAVSDLGPVLGDSNQANHHRTDFYRSLAKDRQTEIAGRHNFWMRVTFRLMMVGGLIHFIAAGVILGVGYLDTGWIYPCIAYCLIGVIMVSWGLKGWNRFPKENDYDHESDSARFKRNAQSSASKSPGSQTRNEG